MQLRLEKAGRWDGMQMRLTKVGRWDRESKKMVRADRWYRKGLPAVFTVEAALLMPSVILLLVWILHLSIGLYEAVDAAAGSFEPVQEIDSLKNFYRVTFLKDTVQHLRN